MGFELIALSDLLHLSSVFFLCDKKNDLYLAFWSRRKHRRTQDLLSTYLYGILMLHDRQTANDPLRSARFSGDFGLP